MNRRLSAIIAAAVLTLPLAGPVRAAEFNPHFILSDREMRDADAMDYGDVLLFLSKKGGLNRVRDVDPTDRKTKDAARLVTDAATRYQVNPKYLLALIQKESSAVETAKPSARQLDWATGYAVCDSCKKTDPQVVKYKGFAKQVVNAADWMDWYLQRGPEAALVKPGEQRTVDKTKVTPGNLATAALYAYTPHVHGNRLLWSIWNRWFGPGAASFNYPDGTLLRNAKNGAVAVMQGGKLRPIASRAVLNTRFDARYIVDLNEYDFATLMEALRGTPIRFPDLSLVRTEAGDIYLLIGNAKRHVVSEAAFAALGFNPEEVEQATAAELLGYIDGQPLTESSAPPQGELRKDATGIYWYVEDGVRRRFLDEGAVEANLPARPARSIDVTTLAALKEGQPMQLRDGLIAKAIGDPRVFVITGGNKRPIADESSFLAFGYRWNQVVTVSAETLALHDEGEPLAFAGAANN